MTMKAPIIQMTMHRFLPPSSEVPARLPAQQSGVGADPFRTASFRPVRALAECPLWMAPALQEKFDVLALVGSSLLSGLLMQSTLDCWP